MDTNFKLVIPSRERASFLMGRSCATMRYVQHLNPILYVREDDSQLSTYEKMAEQFNMRLVLQTATDCGVSQAYDEILWASIREGHERLVILDDDMSFSYWVDPFHVKKLTDPVLIRDLLVEFASLTRPELPAACLLPGMRRTQPHMLSFSSPLMWCYTFYLPHFDEHPEHRFNKGRAIEAHCDMNLALILLTQGYLTAYYCNLLIPSEVDNPGGCSTYRDAKCKQDGMDAMLKLYPRLARRYYSKKHDIYNVTVKFKSAFDAERFKTNFDMDAQDFKANLLAEFERRYSRLMERHATK